MIRCSNSFWIPTKFTLSLVCILTCLLIPQQNSTACTYSAPSVYTFNFINRDIIGETEAKNQILLHLQKNYLYLDRIEDASNRNLQEWQWSTCENASLEEIADALFNFGIRDYEELLTNIRVKNMPIPYQLERNPFLKYLHSNKCEDTANYLIFSKKCEPHATAVDPWSNKKRDTEAMQDLIESGLKDFKKCKSDYIRLRYAYQIVRLAHYSNNYRQAIELFDYLLPKLDVREFEGQKSTIYYWLLSLKAGALQRTRQNAEAAFLFSRVYDNCPELSDASLRSFVIKNEEEWKQCMRFCKTNEERAVLLAMRANEKKSKALGAMQEIYQLQANNSYLDILLIKELEELQEDLLGKNYNRNKNRLKRRNIPRKGISEYAWSVREFCLKASKEGKVRNPELYEAAQAYLLLLLGENREAGIALRKLVAKTENELLREQVEAFLLAQMIDGFEQIDASTENTAFAIIRNNDLYRKYEYFPRFLGDRLNDLYLKNGDIGKAYLCHENYETLTWAQPIDIIENLVSLVEQEDLNNLEKLLLSQGTEQVMIDELYDLLAVHYMQEGNFEAALEAYKNIPRPNWDNFGIFDPFRATIRDCLECPHSKDTLDLYNRGEFIEEILDLQFKIKAEEEDNAEYHLKIGVGLYNSISELQTVLFHQRGQRIVDADIRLTEDGI